MDFLHISSDGMLVIIPTSFCKSVSSKAELANPYSHGKMDVKTEVGFIYPGSCVISICEVFVMHELYIWS